MQVPSAPYLLACARTQEHGQWSLDFSMKGAIVELEGRKLDNLQDIGVAIDRMLAAPLGGGVRGDVETEKLPSVRR